MYSLNQGPHNQANILQARKKVNTISRKTQSIIQIDSSFFTFIKIRNFKCVAFKNIYDMTLFNIYN